MTGPISAGEQLPEYDAPPVQEVALGVQFRPVFGLRPIELGGLRELWRDRYPLVQEQPPMPPQVETPSAGPPQVQFVVGPGLQTRVWFLNEDQTELVQLQHDRLIVNWRQAVPDAPYPRYPHVRSVFAGRFTDVSQFVSDRQLGKLDVVQAEVTYINAIEPEGGNLGRLDQVLRTWKSAAPHHLGEPEQARLALAFQVPDIGKAPVRMYVAVDPAQRPDGHPIIFLTITVRGAPLGVDLQAALEFMDQARSHVVRSFTELTPETMHALWERRQ